MKPHLRSTLLLVFAATLPASAATPLRISTSEALDPAVRKWAETWTLTASDASFVLAAGKGATSAAGLAEILEGKRDVVFTGRPLRVVEEVAYARKFGGPPVLFAVATPAPFGKENRSALGILVHRDNPIAQLTLAQIDAIFSATRRRGATAAPVTWGQLGLASKWADAPIRPCAPEADSGTGQYFRESVLWGDGYATRVAPLPRLTDAVVRAVAADPLAIGVTSLNFGVEGVRALSIAETSDSPAFAPTDENCAALLYPLTRQVYICFNPPTGGKPDPRIASFVKFVLGSRGQDLARESGFLPLSPRLIAAGLAMLAPSAPAAGKGFTLPSLDVAMVWIAPGEFLLGSPEHENSRGTDEGPQVRVTVASGYGSAGPKSPRRSGSPSWAPIRAVSKAPCCRSSRFPGTKRRSSAAA